MGIVGDHIYLEAIQKQEFSYFKLARHFFPYDKEISVAEGLALIRNRVVDKNTYDALKEALKTDPYSIEMLAMYVQYANKYGTPEETINAFKILKQIGHNSNNFKQLKNLNLPILKGL